VLFWCFVVVVFCVGFWWFVVFVLCWVGGFVCCVFVFGGVMGGWVLVGLCFGWWLLCGYLCVVWLVGLVGFCCVV
jgi:hypothetical protein